MSILKSWALLALNCLTEAFVIAGLLAVPQCALALDYQVKPVDNSSPSAQADKPETNGISRSGHEKKKTRSRNSTREKHRDSRQRAVDGSATK